MHDHEIETQLWELGYYMERSDYEQLPTYVATLSPYYQRYAAGDSETAANWDLEILMYTLYAELFQGPSVWVSESSSPLWAADVAAPMRTLWPL